MKHFRYVVAFLSIILSLAFFSSCTADSKSYCLTGAFLSDKPSKRDITDFEDNYGKKPFLVMAFVDWENFVNEEVITDVYYSDCVLFVTWEPWHATDKQGLDYNGIISGEWDRYIKEFAEVLKNIDKVVYLRFAHEMNGNWYPWAGSKIGKDKYIAIYRYVKDIFDKTNVTNVKWVFSINWEDVPRENNHFMQYYPGDEYADYIGIDGYNWGNTQSWSRWMSFKEVFEKRYQEITDNFKKPVMISEFSSTSMGGDKGRWIKEAMSDIKRMEKIRAFVLFNVDKETDWSFPADSASGKELRQQLEDDYFKDNL
ncbi:MAG: hypothetical protein ISS45_05615 [Candidatus Omnitrophica bacterium]|nr:hypothetical protein [Candidatus Omnitrophota bacterium]